MKERQSICIHCGQEIADYYSTATDGIERGTLWYHIRVDKNLIPQGINGTGPCFPNATWGSTLRDKYATPPRNESEKVEAILKVYESIDRL